MERNIELPRWRIILLSVVALALLSVCGTSVASVYATTRVPQQECVTPPDGCTSQSQCKVVFGCNCSGYFKHPGICFTP